MTTVRSIAGDELEWFAALDPATPGLAAQLGSLWSEDAGRPEWSLVAEDDGVAVGRLALMTEALGCGLDVREGRLIGLWLDWASPAHRQAADQLFDAATQLARGVTPFLERRLNPEVHQSVDRWRTLVEGSGFTLFQEKEGFVWTDDGGLQQQPERLVFTTLAEAGAEEFAAAMGPTIAGTLDRNDRWYLAACGPDAWGREMVAALEPGDEPAWLLAHEPDGTLAGYVAVGAFEDGVGTIVHIGVTPARRGRGYVDELLRAANRVARERGHRSMLSDVDTENAPMIAAMERNGHRSGVRPWHVWAYRRPVGASV